MINGIKTIIKEKNFLALANNGTIAVIGFLNFALLARTYTPDVFSEWVLFVSSSVFLEMFRFGLTRTALIRFLSGADKTEAKELQGSNYVIGIILSTFIAILLISIYALFHEPIDGAGYRLFFMYYPILAFTNLPFHNTITINSARQDFLKTLIIRLFFFGSFFILVIINYFFKLNIEIGLLTFIYVLMVGAVSLVCVVFNFDGSHHLLKATKNSIKTLLNFGKFTTLSLIGTNLLRSADTLIISISPLGPEAVALYAIPLKLTEMLQIPLRSFASTAFPKMARASIKQETEKIRQLFYAYAGAVTYLFVPLSVFGFLMAKYLVLILGGDQYISTSTGSPTDAVLLMQIFAVYGLFLPIDRFTGVGLDSINRPKQNFYKVVVMVVANIIGDLVAVFVFKSLALVAVATIVFTIIGVIVGLFFFNKEIGISFKKIFSGGWYFYKELVGKALNSIRSH